MDSETTCLRIKFIQSSKNVESKCCVEIVPEISCIENLDKIELNKETDVIEYTFPMIYKITLKTSPKCEENTENMKTYHSCVDLIHTPSMTENCKTLMRMLSDNKLDLHDFNKDITENKTQLAVRENNESFGAHDGDLTVYIKKQCTTDDAPIIRNTVAKTAFTEIHSCMDPDLKTAENLPPDVICKGEFEIVNKSTAALEDVTYKKRSIYFSTEPQQICNKPRLCMNPIYSISAGESEKFISVAHKQSGTSDTHVFPVHSVPPTCDITKPNKSFNSLSISKVYSFGSFHRNSILTKRYSNYERRIPPDVKLAYFRQVMEREVRPLKRILNNIIQKCVLLGVHGELCKGAQKSIEYEANCEVGPTCVCSPTGELNRAVYNIVFNG